MLSKAGKSWALVAISGLVIVMLISQNRKKVLLGLLLVINGPTACIKDKWVFAFIFQANTH